MSTEHVPDRLAGRYASGDPGIPADELWAVEAHLESCARCRDRLRLMLPARAPEVAALVDGVWAGLLPALHGAAPAPGRRRRRSLAAWLTPAMVPWAGMSLIVAVLAVVFDGAFRGAGAGGGVAVLLAAPVLPVLGVAASWAAGADPMHELVAATPRAGLPLVLRRTAAVLLVLIPILLVAGAWTGVVIAQWLLPCLAFTTGTLALGGLVGVARAAGTLVAAWTVTVPALAATTGQWTAPLRTDVLPVWAGLMVIGAAVVVARRGGHTALAASR
ncbi:membrane protein [Sphaerisporangium rufum]|uniref:Membrane protein n=1 Tax=Sphaerisporangium rufum TaxID=1381558 RepID=A0A919R8R0_9ACTN|nr:zf-HC2 domain-containing protein [Sphaerisporangium rufum]GII81726.1 membrane protein [Sphaerisporangium rufum]